MNNKSFKVNRQYGQEKNAETCREACCEKPARLPFHIVWLSRAVRLVIFTIQLVCNHKTSPKLQLELKEISHVFLWY